eukprot:TRINITY_DN1678_c0_g1_i2.p1 TRINITY_DN1678_c0_g1~~TRINITY_DN1678_c0_g1_i2.p1  ORF type:complete len:184 (-),score=29.49 TRINITY_DN1678_c0_g1_i2:67-618(-)
MKYPQHVVKLALIDPWGVPTVPDDTNQNSSFKWRVIKSASNFIESPFSILRFAGPWGPSLLKRFRGDLGLKFDNYTQANSGAMHYIYHSNAQQPSGESAFSSLQQSIGWAKRPLIERAHTLLELCDDMDVVIVYGSRTWMDKVAIRELSQILGCECVRIRQAGHHVYVDNYEAFNEAIIQLLA